MKETPYSSCKRCTRLLKDTAAQTHLLYQLCIVTTDTDMRTEHVG